MNRLVAALCLALGCTCAHAPAAADVPKMTLSPDLTLDHTQFIVCGYIVESNELVCMSPEEFQVRFHAIKDKLKKDL